MNSAARRVTLSNEQAIVIDDFLPQAVFEVLLRWASLTEVAPINAKAPILTVWRREDGVPYKATEDLTVMARGEAAGSATRIYPAGGALDLFATALDEALPRLSGYVGVAGSDWRAYSISMFAYPRLTGLGLHSDAPQEYTGAFTFFLTPHWDVHWGGLLLLLDSRTAPEPQGVPLVGGKIVRDRPWFGTGADADRALDPGLAQCIFPRANRLVVFGPTVQHLVTRIGDAAGDRVRLTLSGFFARRRASG